MTPNDARRERERRISEITGLQREVSREAWKVLAGSPSFSVAAESLGFMERYLERLVFTEYRFLLLEGVPYDELASVLGDREQLAMTQVRSWLPSQEIELLDKARREWMADEILREFRDTAKYSTSVERLKLDKDSARNLLMYGLAREGLRLNEISKMFSISGERVRQILKQDFDFNARQNNLKLKSLKDTNEAQLKDGIASWVKSHPGCTYVEIAAEFNIEKSSVARLVPPTCARLILLQEMNPRKSENYATYTHDDILGALRQAFTLRNPSNSMYSSSTVRPLTGPSYNRYRINGEVHGPSIPRILQIFGSWRSACERAGVPSEEPVRIDYERRWTDDDLIDQVAAFLLASDSGSHTSFDDWCRPDSSRASSGTVRNQLQLSWSKVKQEALLRLRSSWQESEIED